LRLPLSLTCTVSGSNFIDRGEVNSRISLFLISHQNKFDLGTRGRPREAWETPKFESKVAVTRSRLHLHKKLVFNHELTLELGDYWRTASFNKTLLGNLNLGSIKGNPRMKFVSTKMHQLFPITKSMKSLSMAAYGLFHSQHEEKLWFPYPT